MSLPFDLPRCSRGHALLGRGARRLGDDLAAAAARALAELLDEEVGISGRARPAAPAEGAGAAVLHFELPALPDAAHLEVEPTLVARVVERLAGGDGRLATSALGALERAGLELLALAALDGAATLLPGDGALAARLVVRAPRHPSPLAVDLEVTVGPVHGRARLLLPPAAVAVLAGEPQLVPPLDEFTVLVALLGGAVRLLPAELAALEPGDVVRLEPDGGRHGLRLRGGSTAWGRLAEATFTVEEVTMPNHLSEVPLLLEVELARVPLTLADVSRLEPGATLTLPVDRRGLVTLRLGERPLARGQLVDLDGAVGVQVLAMEISP